MDNVKIGRREIEPNTGLNLLFKTALNVFGIHKTFFSYILFFLITFEVIIGIKPASGNHQSYSKKVGSIPYGFNSMGTDKRLINYPLRMFFSLIVNRPI